MKTQQKKDLIDIGKAALIFLFVCLVLASLIYVYILNTRIFVRIETFIEIFQEAFLLVTAVLFWVLASRLKEEKGGLILIAGFFSVLFIREMDAYMDFISHSAWAFVAVAFLCPVLWSSYKSGMESVLAGLARFVRSDAFVLMALGVAMLLVYGRMFGAEWLWKLYIADRNSMYTAKRFVEEASELLSYTVMFFSALRYFTLRLKR